MKLRFTHFSSLFVLLTGIYSTSCSENKNIVSKDISSIDISKGYLNNSKWNLPLITEGQTGSKISWSSDNREYISYDGTLLKFYQSTCDKVKVNFPATIR